MAKRSRDGGNASFLPRFWLLTLLATVPRILCNVSVRRSETQDMIRGVHGCPMNAYQQSEWCVCEFKYTLLNGTAQSSPACVSSSLLQIGGCRLSFTTAGILTMRAPWAATVLSTHGYRLCELRGKPVNVTEVLVWNYGILQTWDGTWRDELLERITVVQQAPLAVKFTVLPDETWDGLLLSVKFSCGLDTDDCALLKFPGERKHPIPQSLNLQEIISNLSSSTPNTAVTHAAATTTTTTATTTTRTTTKSTTPARGGAPPLEIGTTAAAIASTNISTTLHANWTMSTREALLLPSSPNSDGRIQIWMKIVLAVAGGAIVVLIILFATIIYIKLRRSKKVEIAADDGGFDRASAAYESIGSHRGDCSQINHYATLTIANPYSSAYRSTASADAYQNHQVAVAQKGGQNSEYHELEPEYITPGKIEVGSSSDLGTSRAVGSKPVRLEYNNQAYHDHSQVFVTPLRTGENTAAKGVSNGQVKTAKTEDVTRNNFQVANGVQNQIRAWNDAASRSQQV